MTSKKDYTFFANSLGVLKYHIDRKKDDTIDEHFKIFIDDIKDYFKSDNPQFKKDLFDLAIRSSKEELQTLAIEDGIENP